MAAYVKIVWTKFLSWNFFSLWEL